MTFRPLIILVWVAGYIVSAISGSSRQVPSSQTGIDLWDEPWVFAANGSRSIPLRGIDSIHGTNGHFDPIPIRLEDGSMGSVRVEADPCGRLDACIGSRDDSGCLKNDRYWIRIADLRGRTIHRLQFWAAYGRFQIVPVDLLEGPGDELLIFRMHAHATPPNGYDMKIWEMHQDVARDVASGELVAGHLPAVKMAVSCVYWKARFIVDSDESKPRPLQLRIDVRAASDCSSQDTAGIAIEALQPRGPVPFDRASGKYVFPILSELLLN